MEGQEAPEGAEDEHDHKDVQADLDVNHGAPPRNSGKAHAAKGPTPLAAWGLLPVVYRTVIVESDDLRWEVDQNAHDEIGPWHEQELTPQVLELLPEGGVFLDVGAHVGHYALRAARKASRVIAVEPNPDTAARLQHNLSLNGITNVHVVQMAAWNGVGRFAIQKVHEQYARDGSNRMIPDPHGPVWGARLDDALSQFPLRADRLDLVKMDVEGADIEALEGMAGLIGRHRPVLFIEDHSEYGYYDQADLFRVLMRFQYDWQKVTWGHATYWKAKPAPGPCARLEPASLSTAG